MKGCMSVTRLNALLALLLAVLGLSALGGGAGIALAQDEPVDDEDVVLVDDGTDVLDEDMWCDDEYVAEDDFSDEADLRQVDEEVVDEDDPDFLGPDDEGDDVDLDEPSDDELLDDCLGDDAEDLADDSGAAAQTVTTDTTRVVRKGLLIARLFVPGKATVEGVLTKGGTAARIARRGQVLGTTHQRTGKAGPVTLRIKLTPKGRKVVRKAKRALRLVLTTHITLAGGKKLTRTTRIRL